MKKIKLDNEDLKSKVPSFLMDTVILSRRWVGKEVPPLHRLFPCDVISMFNRWYDPEIEIVIDEDKFIRYFEEALTRAQIKWKRAPSITLYNREQGEFKYKFSSMRLTKRGFELYLPLIPAHTNDINWQEK